MKNSIILKDRFNFPITLDFFKFKKLINDNYGITDLSIINNAWIVVSGKNERLSINDIGLILNEVKYNRFDIVQLNMQLNTLKHILNNVELNACNSVNLKNLIQTLKSIANSTRLSDDFILELLIEHFEYCVNSIRELMADEIPLIDAIDRHVKEARDIQEYLNIYP